MKSPKQNPFSLILICMLLLMITQTLVSFGVVFWQSGSALLQEEITFAEADALMLDIMYEQQTTILLISDVLILLLLWVMALRRKQTFGTFTGLALPAKMPLMVLAAVAGLAAAFWMTIAVNMIPWPEEMLEIYQAESGSLSTSKPVLDFIAVVLAAPLVEELLFRGLIYQAFCSLLPAGAAVVFQGMLFASVHGTAIWMIYSLFMGCVLGYVRKRSESIRPCILMHMVFNGSAYLFDLFAARYGDDSATVTFVFLASAFVLLLSMYGISFRTSDDNSIEKM